MKKLGFNIVLLGMIASGKETQANILKKKYALKFVETGVYARKLLKEKSPDGDIARKTAGKGKPLSTKLLQKFLINEINKKPKNKNLLFLGGRLKPEAQLLKKIMDQKGEKILAFYISLPDKEVYKRSLKRNESNVKEIYKIFDNKKMIATRIAWHKDQVGKTVEYYKKLKLMHVINGNQSINKVTEDIVENIEHKLKNPS
ncbi:MAG: nucleoside monophosphate kinase [Candidatus Pacebacteria bacterium]|nr:nucleoside monophosphate kinase [Candidatus Paceibacterota bacterium]